MELWKIGARNWKDLAEIRAKSKVTPGIPSGIM